MAYSTPTARKGIIGNYDPRYRRAFPIRWDYAAVIIVLTMGTVIGIVAAIYVPNQGAPMPATGWVAVVTFILLLVVFGAWGIDASMIIGTQLLVTASNIWTVSKWGPVTLEVDEWAIDVDALKRLGVPASFIPPNVPVAAGQVLAATGKPVILNWQLLGGKTGFGFITNPNKGVLVFPQGSIVDMGHGKRGWIHFTPYSVLALPPAAVPSEWVSEFEQKSEGLFKAGRDPVYILGDRDGHFDDMIRLNKPEYEGILRGAVDPDVGGLTASALRRMLMQSWTRVNVLEAELNSSRNRNLHYAREGESRAARGASIAGVRPSDLPPSAWPSAETPVDHQLR